jgi:hypothetical protein
MPDLRLPDPWEEMIRLLQRLNFDHLDAIESDPAATIAALAKREPDKAAWLLCEVMRAQSRLPGLQRRLSAYPEVVAGAAKFARGSRDTMLKSR